MALFSHLILSIPLTYTKSLIHYLESILSSAIRSRLTNYIYELFLNNENITFKLAKMNRAYNNPDKVLKGDITKFCSALSLLLSSIVNPTIDLVALGTQINKNLGVNGSALIALFYTVSFLFLKKITPSFEKLIDTRDRIEKRYKLDYSHIAANSEEISFNSGEDFEKLSSSKSLHKLFKLSQSIIKMRFKYVIAENMVVKYIPPVIGYFLGSYPSFKDLGNLEANYSFSAIRMRNYSSNRWLMLYFIDAIGRLMYTPNRLMELSGSTDLIFSFLQTGHALRKDYYPEPFESSDDIANLNKDLTLAGARRVVYQNFNGIKLTCVPIILPSLNPYYSGKVLIQPLFWTVNPGENWLVKGPAGIGKSSLLKTISGLWPTFFGILKKPPSDDIMYIPSQSYMCMGSLRDQIIYPHGQSLMIKNGHTDDDLLEILKIVSLDYLPEKEGGLNSIKNWSNSLTDEESQKICMARLFYHRPKFAILDECTSAVSYSVEEIMYKHAKSIDITLITISNRNHLALYHDFVLRLGDSHLPPIPNSSVESLNNSLNYLGLRINPQPSTNKLYTIHEWSSDGLIGLDETEKTIRNKFSDIAPTTQLPTKLGVPWHTAKLNTAFLGHQKVQSSNYIPIENNLDEHLTNNEWSSDIIHISSISHISNSSTAKEDNFENNKAEIARLSRVLSERRHLYQMSRTRLSEINNALDKVILDQRTIDALE
ncbi:ATP-binding cassette sub-family D member 3 [Smittium mucronatum]|uniref:ATP-binding cassette sub-family D member 3 n=1 Tax=Smittium mucronatum TaxID=133383 RepID=A0A1R0H2X8_9FUNG|nr:ATP-binding cassette sub-family D member 3 [Smittium mucronatum]